MPSEAFAERILRFIQAKGYPPQQASELAASMGIAHDEQGDFHNACKALMKTGRIVLGAKNALLLPDPPGKIVGTFRSNPRGFGFVIPDTPNSHGDLYVPSGSSGGAITGDTVLARVVRQGKRRGRMMYEGRIVEILKRGQNRFVGELRRQFDRWFVVPDGQTLHGPIFVPDAPTKRARPGDQVVVEITQFPSERAEARGVVVKVLGRRGEPGVDTLSIIEQYQFPTEFLPGALREVADRTATYDPELAARGREDLRALTIITIDPDDAKDFDDAISVTESKNGTTELGVHIADVSSFVPEGGSLDEEVRERSTSVYLSGTVIPMLPESLSNGLCSLQEGEPRLTKSAFITYDRAGRVRAARFCNSVIRSTKRLTYTEAQSILDGKAPRTGAKVRALLEKMDALARTIQRRRRTEGMLTLDLPEAELVYDQDGKVVDVEPADTAFSHTIIEMFMVEANEAVARLLHKHRVPFLRRIHEAPDADSSDALGRFLSVFGYRFKGFRDRQKMQVLLDESSQRPEAFTVHLALLRSMERAEYSPLTIGHYALASEHYCHFTSPIRRYPDLTVHRLLDRYLSGELTDALNEAPVPSLQELHTLGGHCSANERRAEAAERELKLVLVLRLLTGRLGEPLPGIITGVANVGVFVQLERYLVDGLVKLEDLGDDWWEVESAEGAVIGQRSGRTFRIGDRLSVIPSRIDLPNRQLQLALAEDGARRQAPRQRSTGHKKRAGRVGPASKPTVIAPLPHQMTFYSAFRQSRLFEWFAKKHLHIPPVDRTLCIPHQSTERKRRVLAAEAARNPTPLLPVAALIGWEARGIHCVGTVHNIRKELGMAPSAFKCPKCDRSFSMAAHLARHQNTIHSRGGRKKKARGKMRRRGPGRPPGRRVGRPPGRRGAAPMRMMRIAGDGAARLISQMKNYYSQLTSRRAHLDAQISGLESAMTSLGGGASRGKRGRPAGTTVRRGRPVGSGRRMARAGSLKDMIGRVLRQGSRPQSPRDIATSVVRAGYKTKTRDLSRAVSNALPQMRGIRRVSRGLYAA